MTEQNTAIEYETIDELRVIASENKIENPNAKSAKKLIEELAKLGVTITKKEETKATSDLLDPPVIEPEKTEFKSQESSGYDKLKEEHEVLVKKASKLRDELAVVQKEINRLSGELSKYANPKASMNDLLHARRQSANNTTKKEMNLREMQQKLMREINNRNNLKPKS